LPVGPKVQYTSEKKWDKLELRIYQGADGQFILYEDENDNYNYEKGIFSTIVFNWNDITKTLIINTRKGSFPGMLKNRTFNIVLVDKQNGLGDKSCMKYNKTVKYNGKTVIVSLDK